MGIRGEPESLARHRYTNEGGGRFYSPSKKHLEHFKRRAASVLLPKVHYFPAYVKKENIKVCVTFNMKRPDYHFDSAGNIKKNAPSNVIIKNCKIDSPGAIIGNAAVTVKFENCIFEIFEVNGFKTNLTAL